MIASRPNNIFLLTAIRSIRKLSTSFQNKRNIYCFHLPPTCLSSLLKLDNIYVIFLVRRKDAVVVRDSNDTPFFYIVKSVRLHPVNLSLLLLLFFI